MKVPFIDFSQQYEEIKEEIDIGLKQVFRKGNFILGEEEKQFETVFAKYCDVQYGVGVNSGTDALYLALGALGVGAGDEVILPSFTFIATALCISYTGAKPVFVDIEETTCNMDPEKVEAAITKKTKVIIPVHIYGQAANMKEITVVARKHHLKIIEDAAQAHGAVYEGKKIGSLGNIACFSFYPTKSLGAFGDGGIVVTDSNEIQEKVQILRDYGRKDRYRHTIKGFNSRLDTVQAVILLAKLKRLDQWNQMRRDAAEIYCQLLNGTDGVITPGIKEGRTHVFQTFAVRIRNGRDRVLEKLKELGIGVLIHYPIPLHLQEAYGDLGYRQGDFPISEKIANEILSLPMFPHIRKEQVQYVAESLKKVLHG